MNNLVNKCCFLIVLTVICKTHEQESENNNKNSETISLLDKILFFSENIKENCGGEDALKKVIDFGGCSEKAAKRWNVDVFKGDVLKLESDFGGEHRQSYCCAYWDTIKCSANQLMPDCTPEGERYLKEDHPFKEVTNQYCTDYYSGSTECSESGVYHNNYIYYTLMICLLITATIHYYISFI